MESVFLQETEFGMNIYNLIIDPTVKQQPRKIFRISQGLFFHQETEFGKNMKKKKRTKKWLEVGQNQWKSLLRGGLCSLKYTGSVLTSRLRMKILWTWILGTPLVCCWYLTSLDYVYFESYILHVEDMEWYHWPRLLLSKFWGLCRIFRLFHYIWKTQNKNWTKTLSKMWTQTCYIKMELFFKEWTYLYVFNLGIFIIYIYLLKSLFFTGVWR